MGVIDFVNWLVKNGCISQTDVASIERIREVAVSCDVRGIHIWQHFIAGTDPANYNSVFKALIEFKEGRPMISWEPKLPEREAAKRIYTTFGKESLLDSQWKPIDTQPSDSYRFFKVDVKLK